MAAALCILTLHNTAAGAQGAGGPAVTSLGPDSAIAPGTGTSVTITGSGFSGVTAVDFGSVPAQSYVVDSATQITAVAPPDPTPLETDAVNVTVTAGGVTSPTTAGDEFTYSGVVLVLNAPTEVQAGSLFTFSVQAEDLFGNPAADYTGTVGFASSDSTTDLPPDYTFTAGVATQSFTVTMGTPGVQTLSVADTSLSALSASAPITVVPGSAPTPNPTSPPQGSSPRPGYDLVGSDGGVFVLPVGESGGFYGSLPGVAVRVHDIVGIVPSSDDHGYFLVGADGGVFSFGDTHFEGSLPGLGVHVNDVVGIVPAAGDAGYFLVGADGGVFSFGDSSFEGSLPAEGIHVDDVVGIAATADDRGYWVVASTGQVYSFGDATNHGSATGLGSPVTGIAATPDGGGYWVVAADGAVLALGDAEDLGSLPGDHVTPAQPVVALVPTPDGAGYWLIGSDGGVFSFGDAASLGSLPGLGVHVDDIVGAVPTVVTGP